MITKFNFCGLFKEAWLQAISPENVIGGFRKSGVYPYDPKRIFALKETGESSSAKSSGDKSTSTDTNGEDSGKPSSDSADGDNPFGDSLGDDNFLGDGAGDLGREYPFGDGVGDDPFGNGASDLGGDNPFSNGVSGCLLYTSPSPRDATLSRMPSSA